MDTDEPDEFRIGEQVFPVEDAALSADLAAGDVPRWSLFVRAGPAEARFGDRPEVYRPHAALDQFPLAVRTLNDLAAARLAVSDARLAGSGDRLPGGPGCTLYVDMHDGLDDAEVRFLGRDGVRFRFVWTAGYFRGPLPVRAAARFDGFRVAAGDDAEARVVLAAAFDPAGLRLARRDGLWYAVFDA